MLEKLLDKYSYLTPENVKNVKNKEKGGSVIKNRNKTIEELSRDKKIYSLNNIIANGKIDNKRSLSTSRKSK